MYESKRFSTLSMAGGIFLIAAALFSGAAQAGGDYPDAYKYRGYYPGYYAGGKHSSLRIFRHRPGPAYRHRGGYGFQAGPRYGYLFQGLAGGPVYGGAVSRACHPTSKTGYDAFGRRARIGGTMCYNRDGRPYVVEGSRYIIGYY